MLGVEVHPEELGEGLQAFQPWLSLADVRRKCGDRCCPPTLLSTLRTCTSPQVLTHTHTHWTCTPCSGFLHFHATHAQTTAPACCTLQYMHAVHLHTHVQPALSGSCGLQSVLPASPTWSLACARTSWGLALLGVGAAAEWILHWGPVIKGTFPTLCGRVAPPRWAGQAHLPSSAPQVLYVHLLTNKIVPKRSGHGGRA